MITQSLVYYLYGMIEGMLIAILTVLMFGRKK